MKQEAFFPSFKLLALLSIMSLSIISCDKVTDAFSTIGQNEYMDAKQTLSESIKLGDDVETITYQLKRDPDIPILLYVPSSLLNMSSIACDETGCGFALSDESSNDIDVSFFFPSSSFSTLGSLIETYIDGAESLVADQNWRVTRVIDKSEADAVYPWLKYGVEFRHSNAIMGRILIGGKSRLNNFVVIEVFSPNLKSVVEPLLEPTYQNLLIK